MALTETEIRPDALMEDQAERFARDVARLARRQEGFVEVPCPACGAGQRRTKFAKFGFAYQQCHDCQTVFLSPRPTPAMLEEFYAQSENYAYWSEHIFPASEAARREKIFRPRAQRLGELCATYGVPCGTLLEVGAGFGTFCEEVRALGRFQRLIAVEPTPGLAASCQRRGLEVISKPIEQVNLEDASIDVIASFEVIEHLFDPLAFMQSCQSLLAPGGLFVVTCPNILGFDVQTLGVLSETIDAEHLNYFHPRSLALLAARCGFEILETFTPGELDAELVRKKVLAGMLSLEQQPFLQQVLIDDWDRVGHAFQQFLQDAGLSSHQWLVARKPGESTLAAGR